MNNEQTGSAASAPMASVQHSGIVRAVAAATIGTVIEWFDFALYGAAAGLVINRLFFPTMSSVGGTMAAFATFAVGFFFRPLGGVIISHIGDRFGRKPALIFTVSLMGGATAAIGLLPTYQQVGIVAPILLVILRIMQGFGAGAEYAGAVTLVAEYVPERHKGMLTGMLQSATAVGTTIASLCFLAATYAPEDVLLGWTWRVPFLASAVLFVVAIWIRNRLDETPEYVAAMERARARRLEQQLPIMDLLRNSPLECLCGFISVNGHNCNAYLLNTFTLSYMTMTLGLSRTFTLIAVIAAAGVGIVTTTLAGAISDRIGYAKVYMFGAAFSFFFAFPLFAMLGTKDPAIIILAMCLGYGVGFACFAGSQGAFLANLFHTRYRYSGIVVCRESSGMLVAGPTPFVASALVALGGGSPKYVVMYLMVLCAMSFFAILFVKHRAIHSSHVREEPETAAVADD
jgi:MFS family permease